MLVTVAISEPGIPFSMTMESYEATYDRPSHIVRP